MVIDDLLVADSDTKDISQDNIINERTRGAQQSAYKQENDVDAAVDAGKSSLIITLFRPHHLVIAINADEGQKS